MPDFDEVLARARDDENVVGVVLSGSRGRGLHVTELSDWDAFVVVREPSGAWPQERGGLDLSEVTLERLADPPDWARPALLGVEPTLDKTGEVAAALRRATTADPASAAEPLDGYVNMLYRSLKNDRLGLALASLLDAQESLPFLLAFLFAVHGRVRPYNKWLEWELERHPLPRPSNTVLLAHLGRIARSGGAEEQRTLFREVEALAREHGLGATIDAWQPDVAFLRDG
ncbi:MAG TPA: nucleotidyltransferase domain-containing protein [Gaiellaceae bacterium]|nr:nucleotidyltransferase domain-containing protein [Gaiellaceae bacterium]